MSFLLYVLVLFSIGFSTGAIVYMYRHLKKLEDYVYDLETLIRTK